MPKGALGDRCRKANTYSLIFIMVTFLVSCDYLFNPSDSNEDILSFSTYEGYSVKNIYSYKEGTYFFAFRDKASFNQVLFWIADHNPHQEMPESEFNTKIVIAVIKIGNRFWEMRPNKVSLKEKVITVNYTAKIVADNLSWTAGIPLVITIPIVDYEQIKFKENGVAVGSIP
jgi:hypothetical protein